MPKNGKRIVITRPIRRMTQAELDQYLEAAANILRGTIDHSEFRGYVFALLFYKRICDVYLEEVRQNEAALGDRALALDPRMYNFVVPWPSLWQDPDDANKGVAHTPPSRLGTALDEAMIAIERANAPKFDGILANPDIDFNNRDRLPQSKLEALINHFSSKLLDRAHVPEDLFGNAYEYLIRNFASKAGKSSGEFYTPKEVAFLMSEIVEPQPGHTVCDWASGSAGLLLQCRRFVRERGGNPDQLFLFAQESNPSTYNISRINMILHGVKSWNPRQGDSLRDSRHLDDHGGLKKFKRILMNPPFSLQDWGFDDFTNGDPFDRFVFGMPPRDNGDYAWLQHVVKSLEEDGKAIIVMSQGVLFRGRPEQTEEEDGRKQKADAEYTIREGFVKQDLIESIIVLPPKLFYGNSVPACLIVLNKSKLHERKNKILLIWASRHFQNANPQNLLRPSDLMRILVPWRAFGDLAKAQQLVGSHEKMLIAEVEARRAEQLGDISDAFDPILAPLPASRDELALLEAAPFSKWEESPTREHAYFGALLVRVEAGSDEVHMLPGVSDGSDMLRAQVLVIKQKRRKELAAAKQEMQKRIKELKHLVKELEKLAAKRDERVAEINNVAEREITHLKEAAADLLRICSDPEQAARYFAIAERAEIEANEYNLNLPRYVDTFDRCSHRTRWIIP